MANTENAHGRVPLTRSYISCQMDRCHLQDVNMLLPVQALSNQDACTLDQHAQPIPGFLWLAAQLFGYQLHALHPPPSPATQLLPTPT
jgi:hypothetical protein